MESNGAGGMARVDNSGDAIHADVQGAGVTKGVASTLKALGGLGRLAAAFKTDQALENDGTWMPVADGVRIKVRSAQAEVVRRVTQPLVQQYRALFQTGASMTVQQNDALELEQCAVILVADWEGVDDNGQTIPCTPDTVRSVLTLLPHLRRQIAAYSQSLENYRPVTVATS